MNAYLYIIHRLSCISIRLFEFDVTKHFNEIYVQQNKPNGSYTDELIDIFDLDLAEMIKFYLKLDTKNRASDYIFRAFDIIESLPNIITEPNPAANGRVITNPSTVFLEAIENSRPRMQLVSCIKGEIVTTEPAPVGIKRGRILALEWLIDAAMDGLADINLFPEAFAAEIIDAGNNVGVVIERKTNVERECEISVIPDVKCR